MSAGVFAALVLGFLFSALFSGLETGGYMVNRFRLRDQVGRRRRSAAVLSRLLQDTNLFLFTVLVGNNVANFLVSKAVTGLFLAGGVAAEGMALGFLPWNAEMAATLALVFPLFFLAEVGPKNLFRKKADTLMYRLAAPVQLLVWLLYPATWPLARLFRLLTRRLGKDPEEDIHRLSPEALREYFSAGAKEGVISSFQNRMLENVASMHRLAVRRLMTPLAKVPCLPEEATVADFKRLAARRGEDYAVLLRRHRAVGLVTIFAVVERRLADADPVRPCAEELLRLDEGASLKSAFYRLRRHPRHRAVVVDAHTLPVGFVRLEDIARYLALR